MLETESPWASRLAAAPTFTALPALGSGLTDVGRLSLKLSPRGSHSVEELGVWQVIGKQAPRPSFGQFTGDPQPRLCVGAQRTGNDCSICGEKDQRRGRLTDTCRAGRGRSTFLLTSAISSPIAYQPVNVAAAEAVTTLAHEAVHVAGIRSESLASATRSKRRRSSQGNSARDPSTARSWVAWRPCIRESEERGSGREGVETAGPSTCTPGEHSGRETSADTLGLLTPTR